MKRLGFVLACGIALCSVTPAAAQTPKLVVIIVADQMRADYWIRFKPFLAKAGIRRFIDDGAYFPNAAYDYGATKTSPGHVLIGSGLYPNQSGIIGNEWYDRSEKREVASAELATDTSPPRLKWFIGRSFAQRFKQVYPQGRMVSLSIKDRAALLLTGPGQDLVAWYDAARGGFITLADCATWVMSFNRTIAPFADEHPRWVPMSELTNDILKSYTVNLQSPPPVVVPGETFSHRAGLLSDIPTTPWGDMLLEKLAESEVDAQHLGSNPTGSPDVLALSFSSIDLVGHPYGPDSPEIMDTFLRFDRDVESLLDFVESRVGKENLLLAVSSDHGVTPIPEISRAKGNPAIRVSLTKKSAPHPEWVEAVSPPYVYIDETAVHRAGLTTADAVRQEQAALRKLDGVQAVYNEDQIIKGQAPADIARAFFLGR
ncbi:MAG TPA: alkaline phosphatase family protein, partial [Elusimicrobiota bacterium]|nr:alkaline phosphatase family protein [Elusimicrobiota bacterium]